MSDEVSALVSVPRVWFPLISLTPRVLPRINLPYPPPSPLPFSLRDDRALRVIGRHSGGGRGRVSALGWVLAVDAQQFRFSSLAPWVERGLPWSLPRPFCLSPGFSLPVDPYRTGEFHLAVCVTPQVFVGSGATHTMPVFVSQGRLRISFFFFYGLAISQYMRTSLDAITSPWQAMGAHEHTSPFAYPGAFGTESCPSSPSLFMGDSRCVSVEEERGIRAGLLPSFACECFFAQSQRAQAWGG